MNEVLDVLLVDDNEDDRALVARELSREFGDCRFHHVIDGSQFAQELDSAPRALVVTDYQLGWSDGLAVFMAVKARWPECPIVMFTGTGNEEVAVRAMKAGLDDYVIKSPKHYARLPGAARMALERAGQRRALREAERRYQSLFHRVPVGLFRIARDGKIADANPGLLEMLGYSDRDSLLAAKALSFFADALERRALLTVLREADVAEHFEVRLRRRDGKMIWVAVNARVSRDDRDEVIYWEGSLEDVSARRETERLLRESEARKGAILNSALDAVITMDGQGCITEFNPAAEKTFGRRRNDVLGKELAGLIIPLALRDKHRRGLERYLATGDGAMLGKRIELTAMRADGREFPVELTVTRVNLDGPPMFTGFLRDITERKKAEKQLRDSREQLRVLAAHLQSVREEERTRIAREVHDELGQALTGLKLDIAWLDKRDSELSSTEELRQYREKLKELPAVVDAIIGTVRKIATDLRPPVLDDLGLEAAVEWQAQEFERRTGIGCRFSSSLAHLDLDSDRATAMFRIFQETLTNIVRHAEATEVNVYLRQEGDEVILEVQDNGRGMAGRELSGTQSLGLLGMRERATMLEGEVNIISRQGRGTRVDVRIPLQRSGERPKS